MSKNLIFFLLSCAALNVLSFNPAVRFPVRRAVILGSHFTTVKTQLKDKELLVSSLKDIGVDEVRVAEPGELLQVRGWRGEISSAEIAIPQPNGQDIGFRFNPNRQSFEMVADLEFWDMKSNVEIFMSKLTQRYSVNAVLQSAAEGGYTTEEYVVDKVTDTIEIEIYRYVNA